MNRVIARRIGHGVSTLRSTGRTLCSDIGQKSPGLDGGQSSNEPVDKLDPNNNIQQHDVAIVGGGMVGMALACALASRPLTKELDIAVIDSNPALMAQDCIRKEDPPDPRVSTVTPATISFFKDVGAWQYVLQHRHAFFDRMQVWDYTGLGYTRYTAGDIDKEVLGCVVENKVLQRSLLACIKDSAIKKKIYPSRLSSMTLHPSSSLTRSANTTSHSLGNLAKLELSDGNSLYAKLVVGADGSKSHVRELAGIKTTGWKYPQNAIICTVEHTEENRCAWQRFLPHGPIALLPIGDNFSNIVWTMDPKEAVERKAMNEVNFIKAVNEALDYGYGPRPQSDLTGFGGFLSFFKADVRSSANEPFQVPPKINKLVTERMVFPLSLMHANSYTSKRVVLIGDAAHTVHPLAGQGVNMGFGDACSLSKVIGEGMAVGSDIGEVSLLKRYESERKLANVTMMAVLDGFQKAYSVDFGPLNVLRAAAFHGAPESKMSGAALDMSLDDLIKQNKKSGGGGARGRGRGSGPGPSRRLPNRVASRAAPYAAAKAPESTWKHDMFTTDQAMAYSTQAAGGRASSIETGTKLYISNLDYGVSNEDVKELFSEVGDLKRSTIHYDRSGRSKGTAEVVFSRRQDALAAVKRYNNVQLDGKPMKIEIVGTNIVTAAAGPAFTNGAFGDSNGAPRSAQGRGGSFGRPRGGGGRGRGFGRGRGRGRGRGEKISAEDLDADLEKYHKESMEIS